jgi:hypothetical protein
LLFETVMEVEMRSSTMIFLSAVIGVMLLLVATTRNEAAQSDRVDAGVTSTSIAPVSPIRALTSSSCSSDGCPLTCSANEALASAICVGVTGAKFSDAIHVADGVMTASCGPSSSNLVVLCARK